MVLTDITDLIWVRRTTDLSFLVANNLACAASQNSARLTY